MNVFGLICAAIVVEGIITYGKTFFADGKFQWPLMAAIMLGVLVAVAYQLDIFAIFGMVTYIPYLGCVLTGILVSRGANYVYDLIDLLNGANDKVKSK